MKKYTKEEIKNQEDMMLLLDYTKESMRLIDLHKDNTIKDKISKRQIAKDNISILGEEILNRMKGRNNND